MKVRIFLMVASLVLGLSISGCKKDIVEVYEAEAAGNSTEVQGRSTESGAPLLLTGPRNLALIDSFYQDLVAIQRRTDFYATFFDSHGYLNWSASLEMEAGGGKLLFVPVQQDRHGLTTGQFLYFDDGLNQKVRFYSRDEIEARIDEDETDPLSGEEIFVYRNFLLNDLRNTSPGAEPPSEIHTEVVFRGGGDPTTTDPECEGGSYELICVYSPDGQEIDIGTLVNSIMQNNYASDANWIRATYDGYSLSELQTNYDAILNNLPWDVQTSFQEYVEDRLALFNEHGIGDGPTGILFGTVVENSRNCDYVWVWCWEDPADFQIQITGGGGSGGSYQQPWQDNYTELRFCEGVNELYDTGPDNPSNLHPNAAFCTVWMMYLDECILPNQPEFSEYTQTYDEMIMDWAQFQYTHPDLFTQTIQDPADCVPTGELDEHLIDEECRNALSEFETVYGITQNKFLWWNILGQDTGSNLCGNQEAFDKWIIMKYLEYHLPLSEEEYQFLDLEHDLANSLFFHRLNGDYDDRELRYCVWAIMNFGNDLEYYTNRFDEFDPDLDEPFVYQDDSGIEILERYVPSETPENYPYFGETPYRPGHEYAPPTIIPVDLQSGYDGDVNLLSYWEGGWTSNVYHEPSGNRLLDSKSDDELFDIMDSRLQSDALNLNLKSVATEYLNRFRDGMGGDYFNEELSQYTLTNPHMEVTAKDFGKWLNEKLADVGGDVAAIDEAIINDPVSGFTRAYRAIFDTGELRSGLKILVDDTEKLTVYLMDDYTYDPNTHEWSGTFYFVVHDNFGLDNKDLINFQGKIFAGKGFAAWWILQHRRGYVPFRTEIRNAFKLKGDLDN